MNIHKITLILSLFILSFITFTLKAEDRIELKATSIIGNKELPKMLYIVPWKSSEIPEMNTPPIESLIDEALSPVDRYNFKRLIHYYEMYSAQKKEQSENQ